MYSNKSELPRRGRSFDSINIGLSFEEKQLNNEVSILLQNYSLVSKDSAYEIGLHVYQVMYVMHYCHSAPSVRLIYS